MKATAPRSTSSSASAAGPSPSNAKASSAPAVTRGNTLALDDIRPDRAFVAAPVAASYALSPVWTVLAPADLPAVFDDSFAP